MTLKLPSFTPEKLGFPLVIGPHLHVEHYLITDQRIPNGAETRLESTTSPRISVLKASSIQHLTKALFCQNVGSRILSGWPGAAVPTAKVCSQSTRCGTALLVHRDAFNARRATVAIRRDARLIIIDEANPTLNSYGQPQQYGGPPPQQMYYGPPQGQPQYQQAPPPQRQKKDRGCLAAW